MGSIVSAITGSGSKKAAKAQVNASKDAIQTQKEMSQEAIKVQREALAQERAMFDRALEIGQPYRAAGERALGQYEGLLRGTGNFQAGELAKTPGYQFALEEGMRALENSASARTGVLSGEQTKAAMRYGQGLASTTYNTFMDRLANLSTMGANTATGAGSMAMQSGANQAGILGNMSNILFGTGENISGLQTNIGAARASGYLGQQQAGENLIKMGMQAAMLSSKHVKKDIRKVREENGFNVYQFKYLWDHRTFEGVIAEEVEKTRPDAIVMMNGIKGVDYSKIGIEPRLVNGN